MMVHPRVRHGARPRRQPCAAPLPARARRRKLTLCAVAMYEDASRPPAVPQAVRTIRGSTRAGRAAPLGAGCRTKRQPCFGPRPARPPVCIDRQCIVPTRTDVLVITAARDVMRCWPSRRGIDGLTSRLASAAASECVGTGASFSHSRIESDGQPLHIKLIGAHAFSLVQA